MILNQSLVQMKGTLFTILNSAIRIFDSAAARNFSKLILNYLLKLETYNLKSSIETICLSATYLDSSIQLHYERQHVNMDVRNRKSLITKSSLIQCMFQILILFYRFFKIYRNSSRWVLMILINIVKMAFNKVHMGCWMSLKSTIFKTCYAIRNPSVLGYFWTSIFLKHLI